MINLFKKKKKKPVVELCLNDDGFYIVKVYGHWMTETITKKKEEAEEYFKNYTKAAQAKQQGHIVVKELYL